MQELIGLTKWKVSRLDTFTLPITLTNHVLAEDEKVVFTIRAGNPRYDNLQKGDIYFQKEITSGVITEEGGTYIPIVATKEEAESIPVGQHLWDLALISDDKEYELINPAVFEVVEVLR